MKKIFTLLLIALLSCAAAKAQTAIWAEKIGGIGLNYAQSIAIDADGNVYAAGDFESPTLTLNNGITLTKSGAVDGYIAKYNSSGVCQWAERIGGTGYDYTRSIAVDASGNVYAAGYFDSPTLTFNNGITLTNIGGNDGFITKYNSSGLCQWSKKIAGTGYDGAISIAVDALGNVYAGGYFDSPTLTFNNDITLTKSGSNYDAYITKYNSSGVCQWAEKIAGTNSNIAQSIAVDASGNVYTAGYFKLSTLSFNNDITLTNSGYEDAYIAKYNSSGMCQWAEKIAGTNNERTYSISVDASGNVYAAGYFDSPTLTFNNDNTLTNTNNGYEDAYIAKYNSSGMCQWAEKIGGTSDDEARSIAVDASGNVYTAGYFGSTITFDNGITLTSSGSNDGFITKYNSSGLCQWAEKFSGTSYERAYSITVDASWNVYAAGFFYSPTITFNNGITLTNSGSFNCYAFITKYMPPPPPTLTTTPIINITEFGATSGGNITSIGGAAPTVRGLCWNTTGMPTTNDSKTEETGTFGTGIFAASISGLEPNTVYKVRAYATNSGSTGYGNELTFTTIPTLGEWGLILFGSLIAAIGGVVVWRRFA